LTEWFSSCKVSVFFNVLFNLCTFCLYPDWLNVILWNSRVVLSNGTEWGCISKRGEDIFHDCYRESIPENMAGVSDMDNCRYVTRFSCEASSFNAIVYTTDILRSKLLCLCFWTRTVVWFLFPLLRNILLRFAAVADTTTRCSSVSTTVWITNVAPVPLTFTPLTISRKRSSGCQPLTVLWVGNADCFALFKTCTNVLVNVALITHSDALLFKPIAKCKFKSRLFVVVVVCLSVVRRLSPMYCN